MIRIFPIKVKLYAAIGNIFKTLVVSIQIVRAKKKAYLIFCVLTDMGEREPRTPASNRGGRVEGRFRSIHKERCEEADARAARKPHVNGRKGYRREMRDKVEIPP